MGLDQHFSEYGPGIQAGPWGGPQQNEKLFKFIIIAFTSEDQLLNVFRWGPQTSILMKGVPMHIYMWGSKF